ncbi:MAG: helix-turn-helix transcriptional regulator [Prevotella sp.]|nr:helix-turn-helix transcriptional regulator [Prevotella sp.]
METIKNTNSEPQSPIEDAFNVKISDMREFSDNMRMTNRTLLVHCTEGRAMVSINTDDYPIEKGDSLFIFPQKAIHVSNATDDFLTTCFTFCNEILDDVVTGLSTALLLYIHHNPLVKLGATGHSFINAMSELIKRVKDDKRQVYKNKIISNILSNILLIRYGTQQFDDTLNSHYNRSEELFKRFLTDIEIYCCRNHGVTEFAGRLYITPKYLTDITRAKLGKSPKEMIDGAILRRAESSLINTHKSIKEISIDCGFTTPAYFARFFRRMKDMTPQDFRKRAFLSK